MNKILRLVNTVKYLKSKQIYFRLFYFARARVRKLIGFKHTFLKESKSTPLVLTQSCASTSVYSDNTFTFLNFSKKFDTEIDWNYNEYGKLWTYNLTYFEYLKEEPDVALVYDFIQNITTVKDGLEPFPISLRGISWVKFLTKFEIKDKNIDDSLYAQYDILMDNLEYHLLGNHLLENGFSLLFGAYYFQDEKLYAKAIEILKVELEEQILNDGAHFELSPMYHQIMLFRVLDCINLVKNSDYKEKELLAFLTAKASVMLGWLENVTYANGKVPLVNDSAKYIAPSSEQLFEYAKRLDVSTHTSPLGASGYRKVQTNEYECFVDVGHIGAEYIPGHAHSDTFSFELYISEESFVVDTGLSTYETNARRTKQRGTSSHNTVEINAKDQSEVWGGFRVANRANIIELEEKENFISATHDGYKKDDVMHTRTWEFGEESICITDTLNKEANAIARLHFHPDVKKETIEEKIKVEDRDYAFITYQYAPEFNKLVDALAIEIPFKQNLKVEIKI